MTAAGVNVHRARHTGRREADEAAGGAPTIPADRNRPPKGPRPTRPEAMTKRDDDTAQEFENPIEEQPGRYSRLLPQRFFDERFYSAEPDEERARLSPAVRGRLASSCAGWPAPHPTSVEFYEALRVDRPTERQQAVIEVWTDEASEDDVVQAWFENVYSWGMLARACRRSGRPRQPIHLIVNIHSRWTGAESPKETWADEDAPGGEPGGTGP